MDNNLYVPFQSPLKFFRKDLITPDKFFTKHFDDYSFDKRGYDWEDEGDYHQIWQTDDIARVQFESTTDQVLVKLLDNYGFEVPAFTFVPQKKLKHYFIPDTYAFEVEMALAGLSSGCYYFQIEVGTGAGTEYYITPCNAIYDSVIRNSILIRYWNSISKDDVLYETGIRFEKRMYGHFGKLDPGRRDEGSRDQKYNPSIQSSIPFRTWPVYFGDEFGLPDDEIDWLNRVWGCDNVEIDNKPFGVSDNGKFEFIDVDPTYRKRGVKLMVEEGVNRNSKIFSIGNNDSNEKLLWAFPVGAEMFGDLSNDASSNAIKIYKKL